MKSEKIIYVNKKGKKILVERVGILDFRIFPLGKDCVIYEGAENSGEITMLDFYGAASPLIVSENCTGHWLFGGGDMSTEMGNFDKRWNNLKLAGIEKGERTNEYFLKCKYTKEIEWEKIK